MIPLLLCLVTAVAAREEPGCYRPLGMEDGRIKDSQISASSSYEPNSVGPYRSRLNTSTRGGAWCPKSLITKNLEEYLEIDLKESHMIGSVLTQGRYANGLGQEFVQHFVVQYWRPGMAGFTEYRNASGDSVFEANKNTFAVKETRLVPPIIATKVRLLPYSLHSRMVCMRVDLVGCKEIEVKASSQEKEQTSTDKGILIIEERGGGGAAGWWEGEYMGVAVGVLVTVIVLLIVVIVFILYRNYLSPVPPVSSASSQLAPCEYGPVYKESVYHARRLPPTPPTSEDHYTDSSLETQYSSPLLTCTKGRQSVDWVGFFPAPPAVPPGSHYAATDIVRTGHRQPSRDKSKHGLYIV